MPRLAPVTRAVRPARVSTESKLSAAEVPVKACCR
jgi:hypothetical protein